MNAPTEQDARRILRDALGKEIRTIRRFPTGLAHYVYDVVTTDGEALVIRLTRPDMKAHFAGALRWYEPLKSRGVPLPMLYFSSLDEAQFGFPVLIMERLHGRDLDAVYPRLSAAQKHALAERIVAIQQAAASLPLGKGYGFALSPDDPGLRASWLGVLEGSLGRSAGRLNSAQLDESAAFARLRKTIDAHKSYFERVPPTCFLDDTTTKNVLIDRNGALSGIVDVDMVAYGDPLFTLSLTRMALLARGYDLAYTDDWAALLHLTADQERAVHLYTALFALDFMSEMGQRFNQDAAIPVDQAQLARFRSILDAQLA